MKQSKENRKKKYNPNLGFIGNSEVNVSNYLFSNKRLRTAYQHAKPIADRLMNEEVSNHYSESKKLTKFLKNRDLTFSKKTSSGEYKTFTVPCTTTVVPLQKSLFNDVETAAQKLIISLRAVIQDIYGARDLRSSKFVKSLPVSVRDIFIEAIETSPNYFPQLHHPNMKKYPFFDNVGLDLVLVEDYMNKSENFPNLIAKNKEDALPGLPFRILEINAGSPSGASNNMNVLEGIYEQTPEILESLGKLMPNDHFKILGETYKSLGEYWTKNKNGVQILLPPGGQNGAAPEIHQLAAYSGLIYTDPDQLFQDREGNIRLRTVDKENPIVTAVYSRVNADAALFDLDKKLLMKDPDTGEPYYLRDDLIKDNEDKGKIILDENGKPIPLQSAYAIPGVIDAIINRKIYMGGLNRILDNKIILATLTHYAPKFFSKRIQDAGLKTGGKKILPPQTLPPTEQSVEIIKNNPDEWVVKAPELAGGQGVYILKTMSQSKKQEVLKMIEKNPREFAYQQLVKIARIPVAVQRKEIGFKFANLAADIRTWIFFGAGKDELPRMSHNALVRYAPQEKGKMSSIVNTSAGGGYAPFVIVDDVNHKNSVSARELVKPKTPVVQHTYLPVFVAASIVQVARMLKSANEILNRDETYATELLVQVYSVRSQLKEILSFIHPRAIEHVYKIIDMLETKVPKSSMKEHIEFINDNQLKIVDILKKLDNKAEFKAVRDTLDNIRVLNIDRVTLNYSKEDRALDLVILDELSNLAGMTEDGQTKFYINKLVKTIKLSVDKELPNALLTIKSKRTIQKQLQLFCIKAQKRLAKNEKTLDFAALFDLQADVSDLRFETLYLGKLDADKNIKVASQQEMRSGINLINTDYVSDELKQARLEWQKVISLSNTLEGDKRKEFLKQKRKAHFNKFPKLKRYQELIDSRNVTIEEFIELMDVAPYAKFNIERFAKQNKLELKDIFTDTLKPNRISILTTEQLKKHKLAFREHAGECFAKKKTDHGLYSDSDIFIWLRKELDPFTLIYTAGHELIHYHQVKNSMLAEKRALKDGGISMAKFLNYYGNFLGSNQRTIDKIEYDMQSQRKPLYGYADRVGNKDLKKVVVRELDKAIRTNDLTWEKTLSRFGSLFGYMMGSSTGIKVKALQEVLPALENAKNIMFAQELGLKVDTDPIKAALPTANEHQVKNYTSEITEAVKSAKPCWEALRVIASHQYYGVSFYRADKEEDNLTLRPIVTPINVGSSYNQTQQ
ncbi:MAG: hypothetical protein CME62_11240 [Halobacteriovoraceae bacterium]|nr:hypothetical protein [Halobacteriovoraceae bacterium]